MREETKEKVAEGLEAAFIGVGAKDIEDGFNVAATLFENLAARLRAIQSQDQLFKALDSIPNMRRRDELLLLAGVRYLPNLARFALQRLASKAVAEFPAPPRGQGSSANQEKDICDFVGNLIRHEGVSLQDAKQRASDRFDRSLRTIERVWSRRVEGPPPGLKEVVNCITEA